MEVTLSVSGPVSPGGGVALWYAATPNELGPVHGSRDSWDGLAITLDSLGWNAKAADEKANPDSRGSIRGHLNDGSVSYQALPHIPDKSFSLCRINYRNTGSLFTIRVGYGKGSLVVDVNGQKCFQTDEVVLPKDYFYGISAATSDQPDSFIVHGFNVYPKFLDSLQKHIVAYDADERAHGGHGGGHGDHAEQHPPTATKIVSTIVHYEKQPPATEVPLTGDAKQLESMKNSIIESFRQEISRELSQHHDKLDLSSNLHQKLAGIEFRLERMETMFQELVRAQDSNIQSRYSDQQKQISTEMGKLHAKLENIDKVVNDHTSNILGSFSETVNTAIDKGGYSIWLLFVIVIVIQGIIFVGYSVYKTRRSYHAKIL